MYDTKGTHSLKITASVLLDDDLYLAFRRFGFVATFLSIEFSAILVSRLWGTFLLL